MSYYQLTRDNSRNKHVCETSGIGLSGVEWQMLSRTLKYNKNRGLISHDSDWATIGEIHPHPGDTTHESPENVGLL
jgi:hypothetical protein